MENNKLLKIILIINILILLIGGSLLGIYIYNNQKGAVGIDNKNSNNACQENLPAKSSDDFKGVNNPVKNDKINNEKCGDGICDEIEKNKGVCSKDCK